MSQLPDHSANKTPANSSKIPSMKNNKNSQSLRQRKSFNDPILQYNKYQDLDGLEDMDFDTVSEQKSSIKSSSPPRTPSRPNSPSGPAGREPKLYDGNHYTKEYK